MGAVRGILLIAIGVFALYEGWHMQHMHIGGRAFSAYGLGVVAICLGVWRLMRKADRPRVRG